MGSTALAGLIPNVIAGILSWRRNRDELLAILHFLIGPIYVIYWLISEYC